MKAVISGRATAFAVQGERSWTLYRPKREPIAIDKAELEWIFGPGPEVVTIDTTFSEIERRYRTEWAKDRALRLLIILIDSDEPTEGLDRIAELLEPLLQDAHVLRHVESQLLHRELPLSAEIARAIELTRDFPVSSSLFNEVQGRQDKIFQIRHAFDGLPDALFEDLEARISFREKAVNTGAFRALVLAHGPTGLAHAGLMEAYRLLSGERNGREVVTAWTKKLKDGSRTAPTLTLPGKGKDQRRESFKQEPTMGAQQQLRNALEQQNAILSRVAAGDYDNARRFASDLERQQLARGDREYLSMSFTRLSQFAREMEASELDLEWSGKAVEVAPEDARARTQMADALLSVGVIDEALAQFVRAEELGERAYALGGRARAMRMLGNHAEQLTLFEQEDALLEGAEERVHSQIGIANALADLRRWEEAFAAFEKAEKLFPYEPLPRVAHGWLLLKRNQYEDAWARFEEAEQFAKDKSAARNGLAEIRRRLGFLSDARIRFSDITRRYPRNPAAYLGLIDTLRDEGKRTEAYEFARRTAERFPGSPRVLSKQATTASEAGRHAEARRLFVRAIDRFPRDVVLVEGQVAALLREGACDLALRTVDAGLQRFTHSPILARMRANVLRRLRKLKASKPLYEEISVEDVSDQSARNALASILILENALDKAEPLVLNDNPKTSEEWGAFLLHANLMDRRGAANEAKDRLIWAVDNCPFPNIARLFRTALANQALRNGQARKAPRVGQLPVSDVGNVVDFQVVAATKRKDAKDAFWFLRRNLSPSLAEARDSIAYSYGVAPLPRGRSKNWIGSRLNDEIVLAAA